MKRPAVRQPFPGPRAQELLAISRQYEPRSIGEQVPVVWQRGEGVWIEDVDGNVFLDFSSGVLVVNVGHSHPKLVAELRAQADQVINTYDFVNAWRPLLAKKLVEITPPNLDRAFILTTGAETVEAAIKLARKFTGKYEIIAFHGAFHGRTYGAMSVGGRRSAAGVRGAGPFLPGVVLAPFPYCYRCPFGQTPDTCRLHSPKMEYLDWLLETESEGNVAAVIVETYLGAAGSIMAPDGWFPALERWCRRHDILLIIDEVQASFGRTGKLFAFQHYGITPNLLCLGKGISSTLPVSALVGERRIMDALPPGALGSTHGGYALGARVALKNIDVILSEGLVENAARVGAVMARRLDQLAARSPYVGEVRGLGLVFGVELVLDKATREPAAELAWQVVQRCATRGLVLIAPIGFYGNVLRIAPPLVITEEEALLGLDILEEALHELAAAQAAAPQPAAVAGGER